MKRLYVILLIIVMLSSTGCEQDIVSNTRADNTGEREVSGIMADSGMTQESIIITDDMVFDGPRDPETGYIEFTLSSYSAMLLGYDNVEDLVLPETFERDGETYIIKRIENNTFYKNELLKSIVIPNSVEEMGYCVFRECTNLESVTISNNIRDLGVYTFDQCVNLKTVNLGEGLKLIDDYAFDGCKSLEEISLPDGLVELGEHVFNKCTNLKSIYLGNSLEVIDEAIFYDCLSLEEVVFPGTLVTIMDNEYYDGEMFNGCSSLRRVVFESDVENIWKTLRGIVGIDTFEGLIIDGESIPRQTIYHTLMEMGVLGTWGNSFESWAMDLYDTSDIDPETGLIRFVINNRNRELIGYIENSTTELVIPSTFEHDGNSLVVVGIGDKAFYGCDDLVSVVLPDTITKIGEEAFFGCDELVSIDIPDSVTEIENSALSYCKSLREISFGENSRLKILGDYVFFNDESLEVVSLPASLEVIGDWVLVSCLNLKCITLNSEVENIWDSIENTPALERVIICDKEYTKEELDEILGKFISTQEENVEQDPTELSTIQYEIVEVLDNADLEHTLHWAWNESYDLRINSIKIEENKCDIEVYLTNKLDTYCYIVYGVRILHSRLEYEISSETIKIDEKSTVLLKFTLEGTDNLLQEIILNIVGDGYMRQTSLPTNYLNETLNRVKPEGYKEDLGLTDLNLSQLSFNVDGTVDFYMYTFETYGDELEQISTGEIITERYKGEEYQGIRYGVTVDNIEALKNTMTVTDLWGDTYDIDLYPVLEVTEADGSIIVDFSIPIEYAVIKLTFANGDITVDSSSDSEDAYSIEGNTITVYDTYAVRRVTGSI